MATTHHAAHKALKKALSQNTDIRDGKFVTNWRGVAEHTDDLGYGADTKKAELMAAYQAEEVKLGNESARAFQLASLAHSILTVPVEQRGAALQTAIIHAAQVRLIDPATAHQWLSQPYSAKTEAALQALIAWSNNVRIAIARHLEELQQHRKQRQASAAPPMPPPVPPPGPPSGGLMRTIARRRE